MNCSLKVVEYCINDKCFKVLYLMVKGQEIKLDLKNKDARNFIMYLIEENAKTDKKEA